MMMHIGKLQKSLMIFSLFILLFFSPFLLPENVRSFLGIDQELEYEYTIQLTTGMIFELKGKLYCDHETIVNEGIGVAGFYRTYPLFLMHGVVIINDLF